MKYMSGLLDESGVLAMINFKFASSLSSIKCGLKRDDSLTLVGRHPK